MVYGHRPAAVTYRPLCPSARSISYGLQAPCGHPPPAQLQPHIRMATELRAGERGDGGQRWPSRSSNPNGRGKGDTTTQPGHHGQAGRGLGAPVGSSPQHTAQQAAHSLQWRSLILSSPGAEDSMGRLREGFSVVTQKQS